MFNMKLEIARGTSIERFLAMVMEKHQMQTLLPSLFLSPPFTRSFWPPAKRNPSLIGRTLARFVYHREIGVAVCVDDKPEQVNGNKNVL